MISTHTFENTTSSIHQAKMTLLESAYVTFKNKVINFQILIGFLYYVRHVCISSYMLKFTEALPFRNRRVLPFLDAHEYDYCKRRHKRLFRKPISSTLSDVDLLCANSRFRPII